MNEAIDDGFADDRIFKKLKPSLGLNLGSDWVRLGSNLYL
jgi:hypothetical protein